MKAGRTLTEIAQELERQAQSKRDFVAPSPTLEMHSDNSIELSGIGSFGVTDNCHEQIGSRLDIPKKYYDRLRKEAPILLADNVNHWLHEAPKRAMVRTLDGNARAFLSDKYRPLDHYDLLESALPVIQAKGCEIVSAEITERKLYVKAVAPRVQFEVKKGDVVQAGIVLSNSEVGCGSIRVEPLILRLVCLNGMIANDSSMRKYHVGRGTEGEGAIEFFRDETRLADDKAFWMKVRDTIAGSFEEINFKLLVERMAAAASDTIPGDPMKVVELVQKKFALQEGERNGVLKHLLGGGDLSRFGLLNAVTATSQELQDYERATYFERLGGEILELPRTDWEVISSAH